MLPECAFEFKYSTFTVYLKLQTPFHVGRMLQIFSQNYQILISCWSGELDCINIICPLLKRVLVADHLCHESSMA